MKQQIAKGSHIWYFHRQNHAKLLAAQPLTAEKLVERFEEAASLPLARFSACVQWQRGSVSMTVLFSCSLFCVWWWPRSSPMFMKLVLPQLWRLWLPKSQWKHGWICTSLKGWLLINGWAWMEVWWVQCPIDVLNAVDSLRKGILLWMMIENYDTAQLMTVSPDSSMCKDPTNPWAEDVLQLCEKHGQNIAGDRFAITWKMTVDCNIRNKQ